MKLLKLFFTLALSVMMPALSFGASDEEIPLIEGTGDYSNGGKHKTLTIPVSCILSENSGVLMLYSFFDGLEAEVSLQNTDSGTYASQEVELSSAATFVSLTSHGSYILKITLAWGQEYVGVFVY